MKRTVFVCELCGYTNNENEEYKQIDGVFGFQITADASGPVSYEVMNPTCTNRHICIRCMLAIARNGMVKDMLERAEK